MVLIGNYWLAVCAFIFCMTCWGSWSNTQKLAAKTWRFELFYWDFVIGLVLTALLWGFTLGSFGEHGRTFWVDLQQADSQSIFYAMLGGTVWNIGNLLLVAAIAVAGMAVAFPIGGGIAWLGGIIFNYIIEVSGGAEQQALPTSTYNVFSWWSDYWTEENPNAAYPRPYEYGLVEQHSTFWIHDGHTLRLTNMNVSYNLPGKISEQWKIPQLRLYFTATNLWTVISPFDYKDPSVSRAYDYPLTRTYNFGVNITL